MMKKFYTALYIILLICVTGTVVLLILSPDRIPMHYNIRWEPDRTGSKYESLLLPGANVLLGVLFTFLAERERKKGEENNEKIILFTGVCAAAFFTLIGFFFMIKAIRYDGGAAPENAADLNRYVNIGLGALLALIGNIMPKARRNTVIGLRTKWSMANDRVWQKSQRFCGIVTVICGVCLIVSAPFVPGIWNTAVLLVLITVTAVVCTYASYRFYLTDKEGKDNEDS